MNPTALTEAIKLMEQFKAGSKTDCTRSEYEIVTACIDACIKFAKAKLPKERQDMEEVYDEGMSQGCQYYGHDSSFDDYFNQNFTQDITNQ